MESADFLNDPEPWLAFLIQSQADQRRLVLPEARDRESLPVYTPYILLHAARYTSLGAPIRTEGWELYLFRGIQALPVQGRRKSGRSLIGGRERRYRRERGYRGAQVQRRMRIRKRGRFAMSRGSGKSAVHGTESIETQDCDARQ